MIRRRADILEIVVRTLRSPAGRRGLTRIELAAIIAAIGIIAAVAVPAIQAGRERSRKSSCQHRLSQLCAAMNAYHDSFNVFPSASVWKPGPLGSLALHATDRIDIVTYDNWALNLLPYLDQQPLAARWRHDLPIAAEENTFVRESSVPQFSCPADSYLRPDNPYRLEIESSPDASIAFARGNYGYNAGPEVGSESPGSPAFPGDYPVSIHIDDSRAEFRDEASGIGGINFWISRNEFVNGLGTMVALEELRAGIDPGDPRGVWAFGQVGGSITRAHGAVGDDWGPNNQWHRADDIRGCGDLHRRLGQDELAKARMPCVHYIDRNLQATSRSQHSDGVNVVFLDGHVRFVNDQIDPGVWHALHHRETPPVTLSEPLDSLLARTGDLSDAPRSPTGTVEAPESRTFKNSVAMRFVRIPAGEFEMGVADVGFGPPPPECPSHRVTISRPFWLGEVEVTQEQYEAVMGNNPSQNTPETAGVASTADYPVERVSWIDAQQFCEKLSASPDEQAARRRYRLPTEAEWEYVCRSGSDQPHTLPTKEVASLTGEAAGAPIDIPIGPVGRFPPNALGVHDLRGNVWEWCQDWFDRDYYARAPRQDPQGPSSGFIKIARGSDWIFVNMGCMNNVQIYAPWKSSPLIGFRVVCESITDEK